MEVYFITILHERTDSIVREVVEGIFEGFSGEVPIRRLREGLAERIGSDYTERIREPLLDTNTLGQIENAYQGRVYAVVNNIVYQRIPRS